MKKTYGTTVLAVLLLLAFVLTPPADAAMVAQMTLGQLTQSSETIARVKVLDVEQTSVALGGGELPITVYTLAVVDPLKGGFESTKDGAVITLRMLGTVKQQPPAGAIQKVSTLPELPHLQLDRDYLLFATAPSAVGLSAPVGLGQGAFGIYTDGKVEMAANELNNAGLFDGPVTYDDLVDAVSDELGR